jgi:hypothetical protein
LLSRRWQRRQRRWWHLFVFLLFWWLSWWLGGWLFTSVDGGGCRPFFLRRILFILSDSVVVTVVHFFEMLQFSPYHICSHISGVRKWVGNLLVGCHFGPGGHRWWWCLGWFYLVWFVYFDPTRECGLCADGARDLVLVFELYNLSNILFITVYSLVVILWL